MPRSGAVTFVGREQSLKDLHALIQTDQIAVTSIVGMGGLGKTEMALQYAITQNTANCYPGGVCWLRARDEEIATQITDFAQVHFGLAFPELEIEKQVQYCWQRWPVGDVLVVIDDVTDYGEIKPYLPPSDPRFKLLMTTRLEFGRRVKRFTIDELDEGNALSLVESLAGNARLRAEQADAKALCKWVGYLPLGLKLVGQYLAENADLPLSVLMDELEEVGLDAEALQAVKIGGITEELGVVQALELSWRELSEPAQDLACLLGMFALAPIPWQLVEKCLPQVSEKELKASNKALRDHSLLRRVGNGVYQLHQIVQEFFRVKLEKKPDQGAAIKAAFCDALLAIAKNIEYGLTLGSRIK